MEEVKKYANIYVTASNKKIYRNILYSYILPDDVVNVDYMNDICFIKSLVSRKELITIGIIHRNYLNSYMTLPFISEIYSYPIKNISNNGEIVLVKTNQHNFDIEILGYYGSISNLKNIKIAIRSLININTPLLEYYKEHLPILSTHRYTDEYKDLTHLDTFSVDPGGTKDIDDCISLDNSTVYVHITDICKDFEIGSLIDLYALNRTSSLYLIDNTFSCIKRVISKNYSLLQNERRDVITVEFTINNKGDIIPSSVKIYESTIINKKNYTYEEFNSKNNLDENILRFIEKWMISTFDIPSQKLNITNNVISFSLNDNNDFAHKFIEMMMIVTNIVITNRLDKLKIKIPYKNHPKKLYKSTQSSRTIFEKYLFYLNEKNNTENIKNGYFGLPIINYSTFTSPIRKYNDILLHRLMKGYVYDDSLINMIIEHVKTKEKLLKKIGKWYFNLVLKKYLRYNWNYTIDAHVIVVNNSVGVFIEKWMMFIKLKLSDERYKDKYIHLKTGDILKVYPKSITPYGIFLDF
jgi:ribonuclease R